MYNKLVTKTKRMTTFFSSLNPLTSVFSKVFIFKNRLFAIGNYKLRISDLVNLCPSAAEILYEYIRVETMQ